MAHWWASIVLLAGVCRLSSSSVTLLGRPTLHGGPVRLRPVRATPWYNLFYRHMPISSLYPFRDALVKYHLTYNRCFSYWRHSEWSVVFYTVVTSNTAENNLLRRLLDTNERDLLSIPAAYNAGEILQVEIKLALKKIVRMVRYINISITGDRDILTRPGLSLVDVSVYSKRLPILVTERWARSWSRCTGSQPACDYKSSTRL